MSLSMAWVSEVMEVGFCWAWWMWYSASPELSELGSESEFGKPSEPYSVAQLEALSSALLPSSSPTQGPGGLEEVPSGAF